MGQTSETHIGDSHTSAFTLPSPRKTSMNQSQQHQDQQQSASYPTPTTPIRDQAYQEFPSDTNSPNKRSPSLPWLVEYWSSSLCQAPEMMMDQLCSCASAAEPPGLDASFSASSNSSKKSYFDDTIVRSAPKVDRSPTKISPNRWEALRSVVASHGDYTIKDYCDFYEEAEESMLEDGNSRYPTKKTAKKTAPKMKSLADDSKDEDVEMDYSLDEDDDVRMEPPTTPASANGSGRDLHTCHSFDQPYIEQISRFPCSSLPLLEEGNPSTPLQPRTSAELPLSPPVARLPERRRTRPTAQISPQILGFQRPSNGRIPASPAPSAADTCTTISLSHSFAREFEDDDESVDRDLVGGNLFLDRLASETLVNSPNQSPFRLRPRTPVEDDHEDEKKEDSEDLENLGPSTPPRSRKRASGDDEDHTAYRCLVRMSPDNYKHGKTDEWCEPMSETESQMSNASSSVLLPLHPHQRIIAPLPHDLDSEDADHSGYTFFPRDSTSQRRRITVPDF